MISSKTSLDDFTMREPSFPTEVALAMKEAAAAVVTAALPYSPSSVYQLALARSATSPMTGTMPDTCRTLWPASDIISSSPSL